MGQQTEQATTERMGVDPLAVMERAASVAYARYFKDTSNKAAGELYESLRQSRAAVAELASAGKRVTDAFRVIGSNRTAGLVPHGLRIEAEQAMLALDAALAPFSEAGR